jgi:CRISPR/Cas system-associated exonuclease Cas4 (RecB family)
VNNWKQFATNPIISHLHDTNFWHYALQLNTYKAILERKYGKKVTELCLIRLHPDCEEDTYEKLEVPLLDKEIQDLFKQREEMVLIEKQL